MSLKLADRFHWLKLGRKGEKVALNYLKYNQYFIWKKNWRCHIGELDIIASKNKTLAFIEVRTRIYKTESESDIRARDSIGIEKQRKIISLIEIFLKKYEKLIQVQAITSIRRDVLGVEYWPGKKVVVDHVEDAF